MDILLYRRRARHAANPYMYLHVLARKAAPGPHQHVPDVDYNEHHRLHTLLRWAVYPGGAGPWSVHGPGSTHAVCSPSDDVGVVFCYYIPCVDDRTNLHPEGAPAKPELDAHFPHHPPVGDALRRLRHLRHHGRNPRRQQPRRSLALAAKAVLFGQPQPAFRRRSAFHSAGSPGHHLLRSENKHRLAPELDRPAQLGPGGQRGRGPAPHRPRRRLRRVRDRRIHSVPDLCLRLDARSGHVHRDRATGHNFCLRHPIRHPRRVGVLAPVANARAPVKQRPEDEDRRSVTETSLRVLYYPKETAGCNADTFDTYFTGP